MTVSIEKKFNQFTSVFATASCEEEAASEKR
jgi:hypothetical protein